MERILIIVSECPQCRTRNLVSSGDLYDITLPDVESVKCWSCGYVFSVFDEEYECRNKEDFVNGAKQIIID